MEAINKIFGLRIKMLREQAGLRQEDIGDWFKMQKSTVSQWENGRFPHASIIAELANKFNVSMDYLFGRTDNPNPPKQLLESSENQRLEKTNILPPEVQKDIENFINWRMHKEKTEKEHSATNSSK